MDLSILDLPEVVSPQAADMLTLVRGVGAGANKKIRYDALVAGVLPNSPTFSGTVTAAAFVGNGAGITGLTGATGGVSNTGSTTIGADTDVNGVGVIDLQTRNITRFRVENDGTLTAFGTKLTIGDVAVAASGRIDLTTKPINTATTGRLFNWYSQTFAWTNGPGGEVNYDDDTMEFGYNTGSSGAKTVAGVVNFALVNEARWWSGTQWQTEVYYTWTSPDGLIADLRPWGFLTNHTTGATMQTLQGDVVLFRNVATGGGVWAEMNRADEGGIDLDYLASSYITFKNNNASAIRFKNAAGTNSIPFGCLDNTDTWQLMIGSTNAVIGATNVTANHIDLATVGSKEADAATCYIQFLGSDFIRFYSNAIEQLRIQPDGIYLWDGSIKQVTYGAADSGGAGFKLMRVAN